MDHEGPNPQAEFQALFVNSDTIRLILSAVKRRITAPDARTKIERFKEKRFLQTARHQGSVPHSPGLSEGCRDSDPDDNWIKNCWFTKLTGVATPALALMPATSVAEEADPNNCQANCAFRASRLS